MNPAWTNSALLRHWDQLERVVGAGKMPKVTRHTMDKIIAVEYGTGAYGTVMPTKTPGVVVKITSDPSEAHFAYVATTELKDYPAGLVEYGKVFHLRGHHDHRPIFILWREEAYKVGEVIPERSEAERLLMSIRDHSNVTYRVTTQSDRPNETKSQIVDAARSYRGITGYEDHGTPGFWRKAEQTIAGQVAKAGYGIDVAYQLANDLAEENVVPLVGEALRDLLDQGILLADVHTGNVGLVKRRGKMQAVITDPGQVVFLTDVYDDIWPPSVDDVVALHRAKVAQRRAARRGSPRRAQAR